MSKLFELYKNIFYKIAKQSKLKSFFFCCYLIGAHINPAVTLATAIIRAISPLRAFLYMSAQCGGGIAGAWLIYG